MIRSAQGVALPGRRVDTVTDLLAQGALWSGLLLLIAYPLAMVVISVVFAEQLGAPTVRLSEVVSPRIVQAWRNTAQLGALVTLGSILFALPLALLAQETRARRLLDLLMSIPFLTPPFLVGLAWTQAVGRRGYLSRLGLPGEAAGELLFSLAGLALLMAVNYAPIVYFALRAQFSRIPSSLLWSALSTGNAPWRVVWRVVMPLLIPGLLAGGFLAFASAIGEYGTPLIIGNRIGYPVIATEIARLINVFPINLSLASTLGALLLLLGAAMYLLSTRLSRTLALQSRGQYAPPQLLSGWVKLLFWGIAAGYAVFAVILPFATIITSSLLRVISRGPVAGNLGWQNYLALLTQGSQGSRALMTSLGLALVAALLGTLLGIAAARSGRWLIFMATMPIAVPAITMAVGFIRAWNAPWASALPIYGTLSIVALFYTAQYLPYSVQYTRAGQRSIPASLERAAQVHGSGRLRTLRRIAIPLLWPHALAGAIMIFSIAFRELVGSVLLRPAGVHTSATYILSQFDQGSSSLGMAMGMIVIVASLISVMTARTFGIGQRVR
jgi:iron(III) transport system permease protein